MYFGFDSAIYIQFPFDSLFLFYSAFFTRVPWSFQKVDRARSRAELSGLVTGPSVKISGVIASAFVSVFCCLFLFSVIVVYDHVSLEFNF